MSLIYVPKKKKALPVGYPVRSTTGLILELDSASTATTGQVPSPNTFGIGGEVLPGSGKTQSLIPGGTVSRYTNSNLVLGTNVFSVNLVCRLLSGGALTLNSRINQKTDSTPYDDGFDVALSRPNATSLQLYITTSNVYLFDRTFTIDSANGDWVLAKFGWDGGSTFWGSVSNTAEGELMTFTPKNALTSFTVGASYNKTSNRFEVSGQPSTRLQLLRLYKGNNMY